MAKKNIYRFNYENLAFYRVKKSFKFIFIRFIGWLSIVIFIGALMNIAYSFFFDTPRERLLRADVNQLEDEYKKQNQRLEQGLKVLKDIKQRDINIYQTIFESNPVFESNKDSNQIGNYFSKNINNKKLIKAISNNIEKSVIVLSKIDNNIIKINDISIDPEFNFEFIPSIQPIINNNLKRTGAGWGYKIHPIYKIKTFHSGLDFIVPENDPVMATASGTVIEIKRNPYDRDGLSITIDHGNGIKTLYSHLNEILVRQNQTIKKGVIIAKVGNTGRSTAPHLHYEVLVDDNPVNPVYYCFGDLSPQQYVAFKDLAANSNQTFD